MFLLWNLLHRRIRHVIKAIPTLAVICVCVAVAACGSSTPSSAGGTAGGSSSSTAQGAPDATPASPSSALASTATAAAACPTGAAKATQQAVPAQQELTRAGFTPDTHMPSGTVYDAKYRICGWTGYYANHNLGLIADVGLGQVSAMGAGDQFIQASYPTSIANWVKYAQQALRMSSIWTALKPGGPYSIIQLTGVNGTVAVDAFKTAAPVASG
ncbi:MAG TPA: hypothetical protein VMS08_06085 [Candidatus Saccharimonadia bacterium]|nr:hypothetical protein [Candidatus Saccharimonadia bacterium]